MEDKLQTSKILCDPSISPNRCGDGRYGPHCPLLFTPVELVTDPSGYGGGDHGGWVPLRLCPVAVHPWVHHAGPTPAAMPVTPPACTRPCPRSAHVRGNCVHRHPSLANRAMCDLSTAVTNGEHPTTNGAVRRRSGFPAGLTTSYSSAWTFRVRASSTHASVQRPSISHCTAPLGLFRGHYTTLLIRKER